MTEAHIVIGVFAILTVAAIVPWLLIGKVRWRLAEALDKLENQEMFLNDVRPVHEATVRIREETARIDARMRTEVETSRVTINRLKAFFNVLLDRLERYDPEGAHVGRRNVVLMLNELPQLSPQAQEVSNGGSTLVAS